MIEKLIRNQTGLGPLTANHIGWLQGIAKVAFKTKSSGIVFYTEKSKHFIYLFPTDEPDAHEPRKSKPIDESQFIQYYKAANIMLKSLLEQTKSFSSLVPYYKIKIVRTLPDKVIKSEKLNANQTGE